MMSLPFLKKRNPPAGAPASPLLGDAAVLGSWIVAAPAAGAGAWYATESVELSCAAGLAVLVAAGWHAATVLRALRTALATARHERAVMEDTLHRAQKMEAVGRLTVGIAHDFNNHLTVISSNIELVRRRLEPGQERMQRHADAALQGVQRAAVLTGRLLSFSRQPPVEPEPVDVRRLLAGLSDLLRRTLGDSIRLTVQEPGENWYARADVNQMENALLSVAVNVREQVPDGGVLMVSVANVHLRQVEEGANPAALPGDYLETAVSASVPAPASVSSGPRPANGLAIADLSMAQGFARAAGGYLSRVDRPGSALSLRLLLPRYVPPSSVAAARPRRTDGRTTILVVEDDDAVRRACVDALREQDYAILDAPDAMEAFRLIADHGGIDLLLTDLGLPGGVSGRALADAARNVDGAIRVVFTTGYERADLSGYAGASLVRKPFTPAELAQAVRESLMAGGGVGSAASVHG
jgi:CheY-like chemotaxis protein